jgi:hypothetical protein
MWEAVISFFGGMSHGEKFTLCLIVLGAAIYYLPNVRRDKNGKLYVRDRKHEDTARDIKKLAAAIEQTSKKLEGLSAEILKMYVYDADQPLKERMISAVRYLKMGLNSETKVYIESELKPLDPKMWDICWRLLDG